MEKWAHEELSIPLHEAASFFARIRTPRIDVGQVAEVIKTAADKSDDELKEEGRKRGVTALAAEATREQGRRGARVGKAVGSVAGGVGGAAAGHRFIGGKAGAIAGLAAGMLAGGRAGEELGTERDIKKNSPKFTPISKLSSVVEKIASMRMQVVLLKLADDGSMMAPTGEQDQGAMTPPPPKQELAPQNYLQAELMGQQAQEAQEQAFYRDQLKSQQAQTQQLQQQLQQVQQQADQATAQIDQATQQAVQAQEQATQQAQAAADARIAAQRMRAQILDLVSKDPSMFSIEQGQPGPGQGQPLDANGQPMAPDAGMGAPAQEGPAAGAPSPQTAPGAAPPAGAPDMNAPAGPPPGPSPAGAQGGAQLQTGESTTAKTSADWSFYQRLAAGAGHRPFDGAPAIGGSGREKTANALPLIGAGLGALGGAAGSLMAGRNVPNMQRRVQELEGSQDGGFRKALALASARKAVLGGQLAQEHPVASAAMGGLSGGLMGSILVPSMVQSGRGIVDKVRDIVG